MVVEVAQLVTFVSGAAGSVGLVATSVLGVKVVLQTLKHLRAAGLSPVEIHQEIRRMAEIHHHMQQRESMTPEQRQAEKEQESVAMNTPEFRQMSKDIEWDADTLAHYEGLEDDFNESAVSRQRASEKDTPYMGPR